MPSYHGSTLITDIRHGTTPIDEVRKGTTLVWTRSTKRDDFNRADAATLGSNWTDLGPSSDWKLGVTNGQARVQIPDGLLGGFWDIRTSMARYNVATASADDGYVEVRAASNGDPFSVVSGAAGFVTDIFGRGYNSATSQATTNGVGIRMISGHCWIVRMLTGTPVTQGDGGTFQAGDRLRLTYVSNTHTLTVNGVQRVQWNDSGATASKGANYRSLIVRGQGGKDLLGPRRFSPGIDYVLMG